MSFLKIAKGKVTTILHNTRVSPCAIFDYLSSPALLDASVRTAETPPEPCCLRGICHVHWRIMITAVAVHRCDLHLFPLICFLENDQKTEAGFTTDKPNYYVITSPLICFFF